MKMTHREATNVTDALRNIMPLYRSEMFRAFRALDISLTHTIGEDWLDKSRGDNLLHDLYSTMRGGLTADEDGVLRSSSASKLAPE